MREQYVTGRFKRHREELADGDRQLRISVDRDYVPLLFMTLWFACWAVGGIRVIASLHASEDVMAFLWLAVWSLGLVSAAATMLAHLGGVEIVRVKSGDLEVTNTLGFMRRTWRYRGDAMRNLTSNDSSIQKDPDSGHLLQPFFLPRSNGAVKFEHGSRTVYLAASVHEPEGREIVAWLAKRLPSSALGI